MTKFPIDFLYNPTKNRLGFGQRTDDIQIAVKIALGSIALIAALNYSMATHGDFHVRSWKLPWKPRALEQEGIHTYIRKAPHMGYANQQFPDLKMCMNIEGTRNDYLLHDFISTQALRNIRGKENLMKTQHSF